MLRATPLVLLCLVVSACPKRKQPERGVELVFKKQGDVRAVVERRLAQLGVVARITEDEGSLTVRVPDTGAATELGEVVRLLTLPARLEFCATVDVGALLCDVDAGVTVEREDAPAAGCFLTSPGAGALDAAIDAGPGARVLWGERMPGGPRRTFVAERECLSPRVLEAEAKPDPNLGVPIVQLTFDGPGATKFGDLTRRLVRQPLLIVLDGRVLSAPIVQEAITGGRAMLTFGAGVTEAEVTRIARALAGGPLPGTLELERQGSYGPPALLP